jgi:hypothetical protein
MLASMVEAWVLWLFIVGVAVGVVAALVVAVRLPRQEDDVGDLERPSEAAWISSIIERHGGVAPASLVEEVLDLHQAYLRDPRLARPPSGVTGGVAYPAAYEAPMQVPGQAPVPAPRYATDQVPGYVGVQVPGSGVVQVPGYAGVQVPGYAGVQAPGSGVVQVPGYAGVQARGFAPANGPSGPPVGPPSVTPTGEALDREAQ